MNRIYGGGSAASVKIDPQRSSKREEDESMKSIPDGFDPIFNSGTSHFDGENAYIKIKPMRLSKGFESSDINRAASDVFEATESSSFSAISRGTSIGTLENN